MLVLFTADLSECAMLHVLTQIVSLQECDIFKSPDVCHSGAAEKLKSLLCCSNNTHTNTFISGKNPYTIGTYTSKQPIKDQIC